MKLKKLLANLIVPLRGGGLINLFPLSCICEDKDINLSDDKENIKPKPTPKPTPIVITPEFVEENLTQILNFGLTDEQVDRLTKVTFEKEDIFEFDENITYYGNITVNKSFAELKNKNYILVNYTDCNTTVVLKKTIDTDRQIKFENISKCFGIYITIIDGDEYAGAYSGIYLV